MPKNVKDVFFNCVSNVDKFALANVDEIKFSKKLNSVILYTSSNDNISLPEIERFELEAKKTYELNSFKIEYKFLGEKKDITLDDVNSVINDVKEKYDFTKHVFNNSDINISDNVEINLSLPYANFLKLKKIDKYMALDFKTKYGVETNVLIQEKQGVKSNISDEIKFVKVERPIVDPNTISTPPPQEKKAFTPRKPLTEDEKLDRKLAKEPQPDNVIYGVDIRDKNIKKIVDLAPSEQRVCIEGEIFRREDRELKNGKTLISIDVTDKTSTICCKIFVDKKKLENLTEKKALKKGDYILLQGKAGIDTFSNELSIMTHNIVKADRSDEEKRTDDAEEKRVELHMHTQMSAMDGVSSATDIIKQAIRWGHNAVAITDHGVAQSFPEANHVICDNYEKLAKEKTGKSKVSTQDILDNAPIKVIYGIEGYLVDDVEVDANIPDTYCVFDLETTGFNPNKMDKITEIAICKVKNRQIIDEYTTFINPERHIPKEVQELTHITDEMIKDAPTIEEVLPEILDFMDGCTLVAHNSDFDIGFLNYFVEKEGLKDKFKNPIIDTLMIAKELYPAFPNKKLGTIAEELGISLEGAHRAINDTRATAKVFIRMDEDLEKKGIKINSFAHTEKIIGDILGEKAYHIIILAKNYVGLKNLYKLISYSHLHYFKKKPKIFKSMLNRYREGLILGSACEQGELYQAIIRNESEEKLEKVASYYDYLEIQPLGNNEFYTRGIKKKNKNYNKEMDDKDKEYTIFKLTHEDLININKKIIDIGDKLGKLTVGTCDVHFLNKEDEIYRRILQAGQGFDDADMQAPLYFRTTKEMLEEFPYLTPERAYEIVVTNTNKVADMCDRISPISDEKCPPHIDGCEEEIRNIAYEKAHSLYGDPLPQIVQERLDKELNSIISNGYSVMYIIAQRLVWDSNDHGYIVGSRGSVGSSLAAYMTGITEVNSLKAHYRCPNCKYSDFSDHGCQNGFDLPDKDCPKCGHKLDKDGMNIPFETFLGFNGDKEPDIDLNFSGEYQAEAHKYTEVIFGRGTTYKAGTIGTIADKTAYGFVKNYFAERNIQQREAEINRISVGCTGIKRTTGQHPGGIVVVPKGREIFEFCPVQHPADDPYSTIKTTHFDYHSIDKNLLKLDILGHDDPTVIRMLYDITGKDPTKVPLDDPETMSIFSSTKALGVTPEQINSEVGSYGIPEFGTKFVRGMLVDTKPTTFDELIRISGLSHGTDVWLGNAQSLIEEGTVTLQEAICCRDDIMVYLMDKGLEPGHAFKIMEVVRKGKALKDPVKWAEYEEEMREHGVPEWYIDSCKKIKYMFPKAHAAAYVTNAFRIAWYKVHMPEAYYAAYMSIRADEFDSDSMLYGKEKVRAKMKEIDLQGNKAAPKDKNMYPILELVLEMNERGIEFLPADIYKSDVKKFKVEGHKLRPPLSKLTGFGEVDANKLVQAREKYGKFTSIEDMAMKSKIGKVAVETLQKNGCLDGMPRSEQMDMFDLLG